MYDFAVHSALFIPLSQELNSIIGGRGSGKSSFLEYISFGLGRSSYDLSRDYSGSQRLHDLIVDTVVSKDGVVRLVIVQDNATFLVERSPKNDYQPEITYPNGTKQAISAKELRSLFPATVYSQGELAEIGKQAGKKAHLSDLLQFVNPDYKREDDQLAGDVELAKSAVNVALEKLAENWAFQAKLRKLTTTRDSLKQRVAALEKTLPTLSPEDQKKVSYFDNAAEFEAKRLHTSKHVDVLISNLAACAVEPSDKCDLATALEEDARDIQRAYDDLFEKFRRDVLALNNEVREKRLALSEAELSWAEKFKAARLARDSVLEKLGEHKTVTAQIIKLREQTSELTNQIKEIEAKLKADGDPRSDLEKSLSRLRDIAAKRGSRTQEWANEIQTLSCGKIEAVVDVAGDLSELIEAVDLVASGTNSQESTRRKAIDEALTTNTVWDIINRLRQDCFDLLYWRQVGSALGEAAPKCANVLGVLGDTQRIQASLFEKMDAHRVGAIATAIAKPEITLSYSDGSREIAFEKASEGQRAGALLFMLLEQRGGPLIVDQPEGDLDNKIITDLTDRLHSAKQKRQLVFASHNANIVVNGSSELVGHLEVREDGVRQFECAGAIDDPEVCQVITSTMEGGERAFKDRQEKYGY